MNNNQYELIGTSILETYRNLARTITEKTQRRQRERRKGGVDPTRPLTGLVNRRRGSRRTPGRRDDEVEAEV